MSSSVAVCRSCVSLRASPTCAPCVKTLCWLAVPYAPSGANVTELFPGNSRQFEGTLMRKTLPSLYALKLDDGRATLPVTGPPEEPAGPREPPPFFVACSVVGAGDIFASRAFAL